MIIRIFVIHKRLKGKCLKLWKNDKILDMKGSLKLKFEVNN